MRLQPFRDQGQALPFRREDPLLCGASPVSLGVQCRMGCVPVHYIDKVEMRSLGPGHGRSQCDGVRAAFIGRVADYVSHV